MKEAAMKEAATKKSGREPFAMARDVVRQGPDGSLEIYSRLPKDHWKAHVMEIRYGDEAYVLVDRKVVKGEGGKDDRHLFRLKKRGDETLYAGVVDYEPEEVRELYRQKRLEGSAMWVESLPFVWGLLDEGRQQGLGRMYDYDPRRSTAWSLVFAVLIGGALLVSNLMIWHARSTLGQSGGGVIRVLLILAGAVLAGDAVHRWLLFSSGRIRPSVAGPLLAPLADRFLRWESWP